MLTIKYFLYLIVEIKTDFKCKYYYLLYNLKQIIISMLYIRVGLAFQNGPGQNNLTIGEARRIWSGGTG